MWNELLLKEESRSVPVMTLMHIDSVAVNATFADPATI
jgi:hypothetical protein